MKPLVNWSRRHDARIRLAGRSKEAVWGELDFWREETRQLFRYLLMERILILGQGDEEERIQLDEIGVPISS